MNKFEPVYNPTRAPWTWTIEDDVRALVQGDGIMPVAYCERVWGHGHAHANAQLICAAPDMYKAIGVFLEDSKRSMGSYDAEDIEEMRQAYIKAGGGK